MKTMKHNLGDILKTFVTGFLTFIGVAEMESILKMLVAFAILIFWVVKIYMLLKNKKEFKKED